MTREPKQSRCEVCPTCTHRAVVSLCWERLLTIAGALARSPGLVPPLDAPCAVGVEPSLVG